MASTDAVASSSSTTLTQDVRPQAGPIPFKRGEIGFIEGVHEQVQDTSQTIDLAPLPARHPADIRIPTLVQDHVNGPSSPSGTLRTTSDSSSLGKPSFLRHRRLPVFMGIETMTLVLLGAQLFMFVGTVIGWVFAAIALSKNGTPNGPPLPGGDSPPPDNNGTPQGNSSASHIFIHVAFSVLALVELVLIERRIYRVRAERYAFKHPGEMPPTSLRRGHSVNGSMPVAPWLRPPLPTYAAALASGGVGTGDVEDAEIAPPPPPAYGQTRGSTLILAGFLRNSLRAQAREYEEDRASTTSGHDDRPISSVSQDEGWEVRRDADRARRIEDALAALENTRTEGVV